MRATALQRKVETASNGTIVVMDPESPEGRARFPDVPDDDLDRFVEEGWIEDPREKPPSRDEMDAADAGVSKTRPIDVAKASQVDDAEEMLAGASGLGHRAATNYDPLQRVGATDRGAAPEKKDDAEPKPAADDAEDAAPAPKPAGKPSSVKTKAS